MKLLLTFHSESDLRNRFGDARALPAEQQTFLHLPILRNLVTRGDFRATWALMVGGPSGDGLLRFASSERVLWKKSGELAIHFHSECFRDGRWVVDRFLSLKEYELYGNLFREYLEQSPRSVVFGKWRMDSAALPYLRDRGIDHEGSFLLSERMLSKPFVREGVTIVPPVIAFDGRPLNPFTRISHWLYLRQIIVRLCEANVLLHVAPHSYDLFRFDGSGPFLKRQKLLVWRDLVGLVRRYQLGTIALEDVAAGGWEERGFLTPGVGARMFRRWNH